MKKIITICFTLIIHYVNAQTISIGTGNTNSLYGPIYIFSSTSPNTHSWNLSIYHQFEIDSAGGMAGDFTALSWNKTSTGAYLSPDALFQVYIKHTNLNGFASAADFNNEVTGATLVYESTTQTVPADTGWLDFPFSTNFTWNGADNIMVLTRWVRIGSGTDGIDWQSTNYGNPARVSHSFNSTSTMGTLYTNANRPNIRLETGMSTGIQKSKSTNELTLYPNPAGNIMYFHKPRVEVQMQIQDIGGRLILSRKLDERDLQSIDLTDFTNGIYQLHLFGESISIRKKFTVLK